MDTRYVSEQTELCDILQGNNFLGNGKNFKVDHLHATGANSRWDYENIWGIYLTNQNHLWMAMWMAMTDRSKIRKRDMIYHEPINGDCAGTVELNTHGRAIEDCLKKEAYVYLINPKDFYFDHLIDLRGIPNMYKHFKMFNIGFHPRILNKNDRQQLNYFKNTDERAVVYIDDWQIALVNIDKVYPETEIVLTEKIISKLSERIILTNEESKEEYIIRKNHPDHYLSV